MKKKWKLAGMLLAATLVGMTYATGVSFGDFFGVPKSDKVVEVEISFPGGEYPQPIKATVRDGTMLTIINEYTGRTDTWAPYVGPDGTPVFRHFEVHPGDQLKQAGEAVRISQEKGQDYLVGWNLHLVNKGVSPGYFPDLQAINPRGVSPEKLAKVYGKTGGGMCCVSCGGLTICATSVDMDCGYCRAPGSGGRAV